jgi:hypothetical protein
MQDAIDKEKRQQVVREILEVLKKKNNLPTNEIVKDCACSFMKVVSCQYQQVGDGKS